MQKLSPFFVKENALYILLLESSNEEDHTTNGTITPQLYQEA